MPSFSLAMNFLLIIPSFDGIVKILGGEALEEKLGPLKMSISASQNAYQLHPVLYERALVPASAI
jgi:hypothetical protein